MLHVHTAERAEPLAARLAEVLAEPPADPFAPEWIAVPTERMRRWLHLELARHLGAAEGGADGVMANVVAAYPGSLRSAVLEAGVARDDDPWRVERLPWALLEVAEAHPDDPAAAVLVPPAAGGTRYGRARRVADLFDRYHVHRPEMALAWARGHEVDATGRRVAAHHRWQPRLWTLVRDHLGVPSPPERLPELLGALRSDDLALDLPGRVVLFGLSVLPAGSGFVELAEAVATGHEVHLFLLEPSSPVADRLAEVAPPDGRRLRGDDRSVEMVHHPLLASWGRLHRETAVLLGEVRQGDLFRPQWAAAGDEDPPATLLQRLQADVRADREPDGTFVPDPGDRSVQVHACYGPTRQVEVLRDALLHLLADPALGLSEDDVVVGCPDLPRFRPLLEAVLGPSADRGATPEGRAPALRYRVADRSLRHDNPVVGALAAVLDVLGGRFDAPTVLDLLSLGPLRLRFGLGDDELAQVAEWVEEANVRWGVDVEQRRRHGLDAGIESYTWRHALDRLLLGVAVADDEPALAVGEVVPIGAEGDAAGLAGRLADVLWRLDRRARQAAEPRPLAAWAAWLEELADELLSTARDDRWQRELLHVAVTDLVDDAGLDGHEAGPLLTLADLRRVVAERFTAPVPRPAHQRGGITITDLTPLRWTPARVVCLLGMDQATLTTGAVDGDDLAAANPLLGDRDPRGEARQTLLETVLAAQDHLVVVRDGHDLKTNHDVPAAVPVAELRDALLATVHPEHRPAVRSRLEVSHPRQAYDARCFTSGELGTAGPWSFDPGALAGAEAHAAGRRRGPAGTQPLVADPLPEVAVHTIELDELRRFLKRPVKTFFDRRLDLRFPDRDDPVSARLPVDLAALAQWQVAERLLQTLLAGGRVDDWLRIERHRSTLPPGVLEGRKVDELVGTVEQIVGAADALGLRRGPPSELAVEVDLPDGTRVLGAVEGRLDGATPGPVHATFSTYKPLHELQAWLDLMALAASDPSPAWRAVAISRTKNKVPYKVVDLVPSAPADHRQQAARDALAVVVECYRRGLREPLPLFPKISYQLVQRGRPSDADWHNDHPGIGDGDDGPTALAFPLRLTPLLELPARADDPDGPEVGRVDRWAHHLWDVVSSTACERKDQPAEAGA